MEITNQMKRRLFLRTLFLAVAFFAIGASAGYYYASKEAAHQILTELNK